MLKVGEKGLWLS